MKIRSTQRYTSTPALTKSFDRAQPSPDPDYSNAQPDRVTWQSSKIALAGALVGAAALGGMTQFAFGGAWGVAGAAVGGLVGGFLSGSKDQLVSDGMGVLNYLRVRHRSDKLASDYRENEGAIVPLTDRFRLANDPTGDVSRRFDGYDSSRNLTGLLAEEGSFDDPMRIAAEVAHMRPSAEKLGLHTRFVLNSEKGALTVDVGAKGPQGPDGLKEGLKAKHSTGETGKA